MEKPLRLFLGIPITEEFKLLIQEFYRKQKYPEGFGWTKPENLHITLCFIGNTEKDQITALKRCVEETLQCHPSFSLCFDDFRFAPPGKRKTMVWGQFEPNENFTKLSTDLYHAILNQDSDKPPIPHITLLRFKKPVTIDFKHNISSDKHLKVDEVILWQSILTPKGAIYQPLKKFKLYSTN